jgi:hypothetical protein
MVPGGAAEKLTTSRACAGPAATIVARQNVCTTNKERRMIVRMIGTQRPVNSSLTNAEGGISVPPPTGSG